MQLPSPAQRAFFEQAASSYQQQLASDTAAQEYLKSRGFGAAQASSFRLGVVRSPLVGHEMYTGRLAIPYLSPAGVVNFSFRCIQVDCPRCAAKADEGGHPKYRATYLERTLFNVADLATPGQAINVTEGELDALTLSIAGIPAVGCAGAKAWKPWYSICLQDYETVYAWGDPDTAGRAFASFLEKEINARQISLPPGSDVNKLFVQQGASALHRLLSPR